MGRVSNKRASRSNRCCLSAFIGGPFPMLVRHLISDLCGVPDQVFDEGSAFLMRVSSVLGSLSILTRACHYDTEDEDKHFSVVCFARSLRLTIEGHIRERYIAIDV